MPSYCFAILIFLVGICTADDATEKPLSAYPPLPDVIVTGDGHQYEGCKLTRVDADGVAFTHKLGVAKLLFVTMPPDFQKAYGYNRDAAKRAMADQDAKNALIDSALRVQAKVAQVVPGGFIGDIFLVTTPTQEETVLTSLGRGFVECDNSSLADDQRWSGEIWRSGSFSFRTGLNSQRTISKFTTDPTKHNEATDTSPDVNVARASSHGAPIASGTGFFVTQDGYILTAFHVVKDAASLKVRTTQTTLPARLVVSDETNDVAVLKVDGLFDDLPMGNSSDVKLGQTVFTVGFPNTDVQGISPKLTKGEISSLSGFKDDPRIFQISVPVQPGNSGGCLVDEHGNVVGIVTAKLNALNMAEATGDVPQNVNYAVKCAYANLLLDTVEEVRKNLSPPRTAPLPFTDDVAGAEKATVQILVY